MVITGIDDSIPMDDQVYEIHIQANGIKISKTQRIIAYKLDNYNSEVNIGVDI